MAPSVLGYVFWFALGMGLAVVSVGLERRERQPRDPARAARPLIPWALALAIYASLIVWLPETPFVIEADQLIVVHLAFGSSPRSCCCRRSSEIAGGLPRRLLAHPVVAWLGLISYGIFLWHYVVTRELGDQGRISPSGRSWSQRLRSRSRARRQATTRERPILRLKYRRVRDVMEACQARAKAARRRSNLVGRQLEAVAVGVLE